MNSRHLVFLSLFLFSVLTPWWFAAALIVGAILFYQDFFEGVIILMYLDVAYGTGLADWRGYFLLTLSGLIFLLIVEAVRKAVLMQH